jgi:hypothetical protein
VLQICAIAYFFDEDVSKIAFPADVRDCEGAVFNPLTCDILPLFDVVIPFQCDIIAPLNACIIVVIDWSGRLCVFDGIAVGGEVQDQVLCVDHELRTHIGSPDLCFTQTEGSDILLICFPCDRTTGPGQNCSAHTKKNEEGKLDSRLNGVAELRSPARIAIGGEAVMVVVLWGNRIFVSFGFRMMWERHVRMEWH